MSDALIERNVALIGAGQMAEALIGGFLESGLLAAGRLRATDPAPNDAMWSLAGTASTSESTIVRPQPGRTS